MTVNLFWSDADTSFIIADTARTRRGASPEFPRTVLGQPQESDDGRDAIEEGAQKIIRLNSHCVAALCGDEAAAVEFADLARTMFSSRKPEMLLEHLAAWRHERAIRVTLGVPGLDPAFITVCWPGQVLQVTKRGHAAFTGSLSGEPLDLVLTAIRELLLLPRPDVTSVERLVAGLGFATASAVNNHLPAHGVGGAFYGALITEAGFQWQPDILYVLYGPRFFDTMTQAPDPRTLPRDSIPDAGDDRIQLVATRVREDVGVAMSSISGRGVIVHSPGSLTSLADWEPKWRRPLEEMQFTQPDYIVFVPQTPGVVAVVPNNQSDVIVEPDRLAFSNRIRDCLKSGEGGNKFSLRIFRGGGHASAD